MRKLKNYDNVVFAKKKEVFLSLSLLHHCTVGVGIVIWLGGETKGDAIRYISRGHTEGEKH